MKKKIPQVPEFDDVLQLLDSTHLPGSPNWTTKQTQDAYKVLESLALQYYRREEIIRE